MTPALAAALVFIVIAATILLVYQYIFDEDFKENN
jgi:hypothetical protein